MNLRDAIRGLRKTAASSTEDSRVAILRALDRSYLEDFEVCAYRSVLEIEPILESEELQTAFEAFRKENAEYDIDLLAHVSNDILRPMLEKCRSSYLQSRILVQSLSTLENADELSMILHGDDDMEAVAAVVEIVANTHVLEKMSRPLQVCYSKLRQEYGIGCKIDIDPKTDTLALSFTKSDPKLRTSSEYAACTIAMAKSGGKLRVKGCSKEYGDINKLGQKPRDVVYVIDSWLDRS